MKTHLKPFAIGLLGAILGGSAFFLSLTAYNDHKMVQALVSIEQARQNAARQAQPQQ